MMKGPSFAMYRIYPHYPPNMPVKRRFKAHSYKHKSQFLENNEEQNKVQELYKTVYTFLKQ